MLTATAFTALALACAAGVAVLFGGCAAPAGVPAVVGTYAYVGGDFTGLVRAPLTQVAAAATAAVGASGREVDTRIREDRAEVRATVDGLQVVVRMRPGGEGAPGVVRVVIRVGQLGDEARSSRIFERIRAECGAGRPK